MKGEQDASGTERVEGLPTRSSQPGVELLRKSLAEARQRNQIPDELGECARYSDAVEKTLLRLVRTAETMANQEIKASAGSRRQTLNQGCAGGP